MRWKKSRMIAQVLVPLALLIVLPRGWAQIPNVGDTTSTPTPGAGHHYLGDLVETVNPANGSLSLRIPLPIPQGRGLTVPFDLAYDSNSTFVNQAVPGQFGWTGNYVVNAYGAWSYTVPTLSVTMMQGQSTDSRGATCVVAMNYMYTDARGSRHPLDLSISGYLPPNRNDGNCSSAWLPNGVGSSVQTTGGDQFVTAVTNPVPPGQNGPGEFIMQTVYVYDADGTVVTFAPPTEESGTESALAQTVEDRNGNVATVSTQGTSGFYYTDTLGRTALNVSSIGSAEDTLAVSGLTNSYDVYWGASVTSDLNSATGWSRPYGTTTCSVASGQGAINQVSKITLPNGQSYTFSYDSTTSGSLTAFGVINQIWYPSGGYVRYVWGINSQSEFFEGLGALQQGFSTGSCWYRYGNPVITDRYVSPDGNPAHEYLHQHFSYTTAWSSSVQMWNSKTTTVTTTDSVSGANFETVYTYSGLYPPQQINTQFNVTAQTAVESTVQYYNDLGTTLLKTVTKGFYFGGTDLLECELDQYGSGPISGVFYNYGSDGVLTDKREYDYGVIISTSACANQVSLPGAPTRETEITYASFSGAHNPYIYDRPSVVTIYGNNGVEVAQTTYAYDNPLASSAGATVGRDLYYANNSVLSGNLTTKTDVLLQGCSGCINPVWQYTNDKTGNRLTAEDPRANITSYSYADSWASGSSPGQTKAYLTQITYPNTGVAHVESFSYNYADGQLASSTDQNGQVTTYSYGLNGDELDRLGQINYPDGGETCYTYNDASFQVGAFPPTPSVTTQKALASGTTCSSTGSYESVAAMDGLGRPTQTLFQSDPAGTDYTLIQYDGLGRKYQEWNPTRCDLNVSSPPASCSSESSFGITRYAHDALGRIVSVSYPDNNAATTTYGVSGPANTYCAQATDPASVSRETCSDGLGRLTKVFEDPSGLNYESDYAYDAHDNLTSVTQGSQTACNGYSRTFAYDSLSRLTSTCNPESGTTSYSSYDGNGNLLTRTDARQVTTTYAYDALNRLTSKSYSDGTTPTAKFWYDSNASGIDTWEITGLANTVGRMSTACNGPCSSASTAAIYSYDSMGRVTNFWQCTAYNCGSSSSVWETSYNYDLAGDVTSWVHPEGFTITNSINGAQQITQIQSSLGAPYPTQLASSISYEPWGALSNITDGCYGTGQNQGCTQVGENYTYNNRLQLIALGNADFCMAYNYYTNQGTPTTCNTPPSGTGNDGRVLGFVSGHVNGSLNHNETFTYDSLNRLTAAVATPLGGTVSYNLSFSYDRYGNMTCVLNGSTNGPCPQLGYGTGSTNRISTFGGSSVTYDADGNLTNDGVYAYTYDAEGRVTSMTGGGLNNTYSYDALGRRATWSWNGAQYLYDPSGGLLGIFSSQTGSWYFETVTFAGQRRFDYLNGNLYAYHPDALGTMRLATLKDGSVSGDTLLYPWGQSWTSSGSPTNLFAGFQGWDGNVPMYVGQFRAYPVNYGRWLTPDPAGKKAVRLDDPQAWNAYAYAGNNPTTNVDPDGEDYYLAGGNACGGNVQCDSEGYILDQTGSRLVITDQQVLSGEVEITAGLNGTTWLTTSQGTFEAQFFDPSPDTVQVAAAPGSALAAVGTNFFFGIWNQAADITNTMMTELTIGQYSPNFPQITGGSGADAVSGQVLAMVAPAFAGDDEPTPGQLSQAEQVLLRDGRGAVARGIRSLEKALAEHEEKIRNATGHTSSMETEVRNFRRLIRAYKQVLGR